MDHAFEFELAEVLCEDRDGPCPSAEEVLFRNRDWTVTDAGLLHPATDTFIPRPLLGDRRSDGLWSWPLHLSEKSWFRADTFVPAFTRAALAYGLALDAELAVSLVASVPEEVSDRADPALLGEVTAGLVATFRERGPAAQRARMRVELEGTPRARRAAGR